MSAIGGIYFFDGATVDERSLRSLGEQLSRRNFSEGREVTQHCIGITFRDLPHKKGSCFQRQPIISPNGQVLGFDGRLDNRDELIVQLGLQRPNDLNDVAIVMAAYERWALDFLPKLVGDFALALWDPHERTLILARDPIGPRTLYFYSDNRSITWSTELEPLLNFNNVHLEINEEYIADYLTRLPEPGQTPYKHVQAVSPAHAVIVKHGQISSRRFWRLTPRTSIRYTTDDEYEQHFRQLFREAVRCRLRDDGPVWMELSGGLDSSSIVCMAKDIIVKGEAQCPGIETVSIVFDEASRSDERVYISRVEERVGQRGIHLLEDEYRFLATPKSERLAVPNPVANFAEYYGRLNELMSQTASRVLISGKGGDEIMNAAEDPSPLLIDLFRHGCWWELHCALVSWNQFLHKSYLELIWKSLLLPLMPQLLRTSFRRKSGFHMIDLYEPEFVARMNLHMRTPGPSDVFGFHEWRDKARAVSFLRMVRELSGGFWQEFVECQVSYPFTHRPLIEFMQAIPFEQTLRPGESRSLVRRALHDLLPEEIRRRPGKTINTDAITRGVWREWPRLKKIFADARVSGYGYVNRERLLWALGASGNVSRQACAAAAFLIPLEYWLRAFEHRAYEGAHSLRQVNRNTRGYVE